MSVMILHLLRERGNNRNIRGSVKRLVRERHNLRREFPFVILSNKEFRANFRFTREGFERLLTELRPYISVGTTKFAIPAEIKLLAVLRFLAHGTYQRGVCTDSYLCISQSTFSRVLHEVIEVMNERLCPKYVKFPDSEEMNEISNWFRRKFRIPGIVGIIDGTQISIVGPMTPNNEYPEFVYVCRKGFHSINVELVSDHKYQIRAINARYPGSAHDSFIWKHSSVRTHMRELHMRKKIWIIGDSGYPLEPWIITPYKAPETEAAKLFNSYFTSARSIVERSIGVWKARWRCLRKERGLHYHPTMSSKIINACSALHNMCIQCDGRYYLDIHYEIENQEDHAVHFESSIQELGVRQRNELLGYVL